MKPTRIRGLAACVVLSWIFMAQPAGAAVQAIFFDTLAASVPVAPTLQAGDTLLLDTLVRGQTGALSQSLTFNVGAGVSSLSGLAAWAVSPAAGLGPRLIGLDVNIFDSADQLVASDSFSGVTSGFASSSFSSIALAEGAYRLVATGTGIRDSMFDLALSFEGTTPAVPSVSGGALPVQGPSTAEKTAFFQQLQDTRTITTEFTAGDTLLVDSLVVDGTGALTQTTVFKVGQGVDGIIADISQRKHHEMRIEALLTEQSAILDNVMFGVMFAAVVLSAVVLAPLVTAAMMAAGMASAVPAPMPAASMRGDGNQRGPEECSRQHVPWSSFQHESPCADEAAPSRKVVRTSWATAARRMSLRKVL